MTAASFQDEIDRVFHAAIHALAGERRHQVGGVASQENPAFAPLIGDARVKGVNGLSLDLDFGAVDERRKQDADRFVTNRSSASRRATA